MLYVCYSSDFIDLMRDLVGFLATTSRFTDVVFEVLDVALIEELESITVLLVKEAKFIEAILASCFSIDVAFQQSSLFIICVFLAVKEESAM